MEERLREVDLLHERGLITAEERVARRMAIVTAPAEADDGRETAGPALGIAGGVVGIGFAFVAILVGNVAVSYGADGGGEVLWLGISALLAAIAGIVCAASMGGSRRGWWVAGLGIAAAWHLISISVFGIPGAALMACGCVAGVLRR